MADLQYAQVGIPFTSPGYEIKTQEELEAYVRSVEKARVAMWQALAGSAMSGTSPREQVNVNSQSVISTAVAKQQNPPQLGTGMSQ